MPKYLILTLMLLSSAIASLAAPAADKPWLHGNLQPTPDGAYLQHTDGTPFFWLGDTGWLMPQKLDRSEVGGYLQALDDAGYNVVQIQVLNGVPTINGFGQKSHINGWDFSNIDREDTYGYWDHMDYIIDTAAAHGIYMGMVCIWGGLVKRGDMDADQARAYGNFLADRYAGRPNIIWIMGGDVRGDIKPEVWESLATTIRAKDKAHLMTYHPFGRTSSAYWWNDADWIDLNMFQSGHRRYDQTRGDGDDSAAAAVAEDNWRYVEDAIKRSPRRPILDAEPSYEGIPQGLHDTTQPLWQGHDARRYAWWSVLAGSAGHTYGNSAIMQFKKPGNGKAYGCDKNWYDALNDPGFNQMKHLKNLMLTLPYYDRVPDQQIIAGDQGYRYDRPVASRGKDYLVVYNYTNRPMDIDLTRISGKTKRVWWYSPVDGSFEYVGEFPSAVTSFHHDSPYAPGNDRVLVAIDADSNIDLQPGR